MSTKVYIRDENGSFYSENRKTRFRMVVVEKFDDYINSEECIGKAFFRMYDSEGCKIAIEGNAEIIEGYIKERRHSRYIKDSMDELGIVVISGDAPVKDADSPTIFEKIVDDSFSFEELDEVLSLRMEFKKLDEEEQQLIKRIFRAERCLSEKEVAKQMRRSQQTISYRKGVVLEKLNKNLKN